jgi:hypothetical protein
VLWIRWKGLRWDGNAPSLRTWTTRFVLALDNFGEGMHATLVGYCDVSRL